MALRLTAEYINGSLKPLEPLDLKEGTVVTLYIEEQNQRQVHSALAIADRNRQSAPAEIWDNLPTDGAKNYRHYLYGHPKEEE
ncbi:MAG: antitoxin family protein [Chloroflexi bacterium]|nr:antitoxin family protein [Chloroflexota bacterium]